MQYKNGMLKTPKPIKNHAIKQKYHKSSTNTVSC